MRLYLSSYKLGRETETLKKWMEATEKRVGYISNALDSSANDHEWLTTFIEQDRGELRDLGFKVEDLNLRSYFGEKEKLRSKLRDLDMLWVSEGNTFILRQAMRISGFDELVDELSKRTDFIYGGYSAGCCVLSPTLKGLQIVDDPSQHPYENCKETIWEGLGLIDYAFLPHYDSDHPESEDINKEVTYCTENHLPFKTVRDGDVILIEAARIQNKKSMGSK